MALELVCVTRTVTSTDGTRIAYEQHGDGPPLVLLHGDSTHDYWDPVIPFFVDEYTVIAPDRRGRGESGDNDAYALRREVEDTRAVIEAVDGEPILFGHSFGGLQAIEAARCESVAALIAYEPAVLVGQYRKQADLAATMEAHLEAGNEREAMKCHVREVLHGGNAVDLDGWLEAWPPWPEYARFAHQSARMNQAIEGYQLPEELEIDAPALLLTGTNGPSHLRDSVRAVTDALPDSQLVEFERASHIGPVEAPERVARAVNAFLSRALD